MSLYKRYIPPSSAAVSAPVTSVSAPVQVSQGTSTAAAAERENKRKRERSQDEVAERKAKKLRKKGVDPVTIEQVVASTRVKEAVVASPKPVQPTTTNGADAAVKPVAEDEESGAAPRMSMKKRHKLEKEARKARKAAEKDGLPVEDKPPSTALEAPRQDTARQDSGEKEAAIHVGAGPTPPPQDTATNTKVENVPATIPAPSKKRRHKLEAILAEPALETAVADNDNDQHLKKHISVLGKFQKSAQRMRPDKVEENHVHPSRQQQVVQDLSLPEAKQSDLPELSPDAAMPEWLAKPTILSSDCSKTFSDLGLSKVTADRLSRLLSSSNALPVQQVLIPLLLPAGSPGSAYPPRTDEVLPDVAVSAPTGSGKTISYLLPITEALRMAHDQRDPRVKGRLSALIIVPTRELVYQVAAVAEALSKGSNIKVGMSTGTGKFKDEQDKLVKRGQRYDPEAYQRFAKQAKLRLDPPNEGSAQFEAWLEDLHMDDGKADQRLEHIRECAGSYVPTYESALDILVATPGRLLEHLENTIGFNLVHLQYLVIDEADKLLDNESRSFLIDLNSEISRTREPEEQDAREQYLRSQNQWNERSERMIRKVVLSATMSKDISKLTTLRLRRPKFILVGGTEDLAVDGSLESGETGSVMKVADGFELPRTLTEHCVPVGDGSEKPLVAFELLRSRILGQKFAGQPAPKQAKKIDSDSGSGSDDDSESDSDSSSDSDDSSMSSDDSSSSGSGRGSDAEADDAEGSDNVSMTEAISKPSKPSTSAESKHSSAENNPEAPTVLIFTSSNESAKRLSHLLIGTIPSWSPYISTLLKEKRNKTNLKASDPAIVISTDRAARGLDSFAGRSVTHVLQYDVPGNVEAYVHRVGRTARAGRKGEAWTLYTHAQARWFVNDVTKAVNVKRVGEVERVKVFCEDQGLREAYGRVLEGMREEVFGGK